MDIYAYAIFNTPTTELQLPTGIANPVQLVLADRISAAIELDVDLEALQADSDRLMQAVLAHDRVLWELFQQTPILPLRFGTRFRAIADLQAHLTQQEQIYRSQLQRFVDRAEYAIKLMPQEAPVAEMPTEAKGKAYLLAKKHRYQTQQDFHSSQAAQWEQIRSVITEVYPEAIATSSEDNTHRIFLLVSLQEELLLHQQFHQWQQVCPHWTLQLSGPFPPYHFL